MQVCLLLTIGWIHSVPRPCCLWVCQRSKCRCTYCPGICRHLHVWFYFCTIIVLLSVIFSLSKPFLFLYDLSVDSFVLSCSHRSQALMLYVSLMSFTYLRPFPNFAITSSSLTWQAWLESSWTCSVSAVPVSRSPVSVSVGVLISFIRFCNAPFSWS